MATVIRSKDYDIIEERLAQDPIVIAMAHGLADVPRKELVSVDSDGDEVPRFEFMMSANKEYRERGGSDGGHIGAVAHALLRVLDSGEVKPTKVVTYFASRDSLSAWRDEDRAMAHAQIVSEESDLDDAKQAMVDYITKEVGYKIKNGLMERNREAVEQLIGLIPQIYAAEFSGEEDWEAVNFDTAEDGLRFRLVRTAKKA
jgi:hypothetical protein